MQKTCKKSCLLTFSESKQQGISLQAARYSSEDAASIMEYVQQVVHYTLKYRPYIQTVELLASLKAEKLHLERKKQEANLLNDDAEKFIMVSLLKNFEFLRFSG